MTFARAVVLLVIVGVATPAAAQGTPSEADTLFHRGRDLFAAGKIAEACDAFEASEKLEAASTTLLALGVCRDKNGQLATAWSLFSEVVRRTHDATDDANKQLALAATADAAKLEPRLSRLTIIVPALARVPGLEIRRGADVVPPSDWNEAIPVDGGTIQIVAHAPDHTPWTTTITIKAEGDRQTIEVPPPAVPLAAIRSDKELAAALASITQDPTIAVNDPKVRSVAQALMIEGVKRLNAKSYDQALANFLDAYGMLPSPRILLDIGSTLRDMGRAADAANTYQRYILDPGTGADRVGEVKQLLIDLDATLTILTVHVFPRGSELSIDGGPFIPVGSTLVTRVRAGIHLVRIRHGKGSAELTVNGFAGEDKELAATLPVDAAEPIAAVPTPAKPPTTPTTSPASPTPAAPPKPAEPPERVDAWLSTGTGYTSGNPGGNDRRVRDGFEGEEILPIIPRFDEVDGTVVIREPEPEIGSGLLAMTRIDGRGRGVAAGFGIALSAKHLELEAAVLRSEQWGAYVGLRYRLLTGAIRPYVGAGVPIFEFDDDREAGDPTKVSYGIRGAAGIEIMINGHFSVQGDVGYERFFHLEGTSFDTNLFVPTLGVIGRM